MRKVSVVYNTTSERIIEIPEETIELESERREAHIVRECAEKMNISSFDILSIWDAETDDLICERY